MIAQHYYQPKNTRISIPPGGQSSLRLGWDQDEQKSNQFTSTQDTAQLRTKHKYPKQQSYDPQHLPRNPSFNNNISLQPKKTRESSHFTQAVSSDSTNFSNQIFTPFSQKKKPYQQYLSPNFIEQKNINYIPKQSQIHDWKQSAHLLEQQLKYYQDKNRLLKEKLFGGYQNEDALRKFQGDFYSNRKNRKLHQEQPEQLDLAIMERYKNIHSHQLTSNSQSTSSPKRLTHFANSFNTHSRGQSLDVNQNMNLQLYAQGSPSVKTSVKVHHPPGGISSIKFG